MQLYMSEIIFFTPLAKPRQLGLNLLQTEQTLFKQMIVSLKAKLDTVTPPSLEHQCLKVE